jgi:hypothetical protein
MNSLDKADKTVEETATAAIRSLGPFYAHPFGPPKVQLGLEVLYCREMGNEFLPFLHAYAAFLALGGHRDLFAFFP